MVRQGFTYKLVCYAAMQRCLEDFKSSSDQVCDWQGHMSNWSSIQPPSFAMPICHCECVRCPIWQNLRRPVWTNQSCCIAERNRLESGLKIMPNECKSRFDIRQKDSSHATGAMRARDSPADRNGFPASERLLITNHHCCYTTTAVRSRNSLVYFLPSADGKAVTSARRFPPAVQHDRCLSLTVAHTIKQDCSAARRILIRKP